MQKKHNAQPDKLPSPPRVIADFGGRRKTFERRIKNKAITHNDRRDDGDRRSGFDRRGVFPQDNVELDTENRKNPPESTTSPKPEGLDTQP